MKKISDMELKAIIYKHAKWARGEDGGERANLCCANLRGAYLCDANLYGAYLCDADLYCANLRGADLCGAKNTDKTVWDAYTAFYPLQCPETGSLLGKKRKLTAWITTCWGNEVE